MGLVTGRLQFNVYNLQLNRINGCLMWCVLACSPLDYHFLEDVDRAISTAARERMAVTGIPLSQRRQVGDFDLIS